jgi:hypothetical protein
LKRAVQIEYLETRGIDTRDESATAEQLGAEETRYHRSNRKSLMGNTAPLEARPSGLRVQVVLFQTKRLIRRPRSKISKQRLSAEPQG